MFATEKSDPFLSSHGQGAFFLGSKHRKFLTTNSPASLKGFHTEVSPPPAAPSRRPPPRAPCARIPFPLSRPHPLLTRPLTSLAPHGLCHR